jgi:hypothetical protein
MGASVLERAGPELFHAQSLATDAHTTARHRPAGPHLQYDTLVTSEGADLDNREGARSTPKTCSAASSATT